jgi:hypothetical protein
LPLSTENVPAFFADSELHQGQCSGACSMVGSALLSWFSGCFIAEKRNEKASFGVTITVRNQPEFTFFSL